MLENVGKNFDLKSLFKAQEESIKICHEIKQEIKPGMFEEEALDIAQRVLNDHNVQKVWHQTKIRFGKNTTLPFKGKSDSDIMLKDDDIFFIDIGPIIDNHEADYGETFSVQENSSNFSDIAKKSKELFSLLADAWKKENLTGKSLYERGITLASKMGYDFSLSENGHRIGDFPHHIYYRGSLENIDNLVPAPNLWILEVKLLSKDGSFGAFYEDILK